MSTIQNFIKRHYIKITSATALAVGLYKFAEYAVVDHSKGQSYPLAFMQNVYWLLQERLGILEQDKIPYKEEDISKETIQYCLRTGGIILPDTAQEKPQQGTVVAAGPGKVSDSGNLVEMTVKNGDKVLYGKYSGSEVTFDGTEYVIMRESDILAVL